MSTLMKGNSPIGIVGSGGSGGGHVIIDPSGESMTQQPNMQFTDSHISDNSTNEKTVIENIKSVTEAQFESATEDGLYDVDVEGAEIGEISEEYVEVEADGNKTYAQLLNGLYADADLTKVNVSTTKLKIGSSIFNIFGLSNYECYFSASSLNSQLPATEEIRVSSSSYYNRYRQGQFSDLSSTKPTSGTKITLYYGNDKAVVDLQTTANRCLYDSNTTVKQKLDVTDVTVTPVNGNITAGGVKRQGNLIVINIRYVSTSATAVGDAIVTFPYDITSTTAHVSLANSQNYAIDLLGNRIRTNTAIASGTTIMISGAVFVE